MDAGDAEDLARIQILASGNACSMDLEKGFAKEVIFRSLPSV
jgi:hypothetical protein